MIKRYNKIELLIPDNFEEIDRKDYAKYQLQEVEDVKILDAFFKNDENNITNIISLMCYGEIPNYIKELEKYLKNLQKILKKSIDWQDESEVYPIDFGNIKIGETKIFVNLLATIDNNENVIQIYFMFNKNIYCFNTNIHTKHSIIKNALADNVCLEILDIIKSAKK